MAGCLLLALIALLASCEPTMTAAAPNFNASNAAVNVGGESAQMGDVEVGDGVGRDKIEGSTIYQGVSAEQVIDLLKSFLNKEPQRAKLEQTAREVMQRSTEQKLDRIAVELGHAASVLNRLTLALSVQALVLFLLLVTSIGMLFILAAGPRLVAFIGS
jgi:hypothetical protein